MIQIDKSDHHQRGQQQPIDQRRRTETEIIKGQRKQQPRQGFDGWVTQRNGCVAGGTAASQKKITEDRDILIPADALTALRAGRRWRYNRLGGGDSADADIQKGADDRAKDKGGSEKEIKLKGHRLDTFLT